MLVQCFFNFVQLCVYLAIYIMYVSFLKIHKSGVSHERLHKWLIQPFQIYNTKSFIQKPWHALLSFFFYPYEYLPKFPHKKRKLVSIKIPAASHIRYNFVIQALSLLETIHLNLKCTSLSDMQL